MPHIHDAIDFTVGAFLVNNGRVALIHHKELKKWLSVGGHIELNEDPDEALFREIKEEAGIDRNELIVLSEKPTIHDPNTKFLYTPNYLDIHKISETHRHVVLVYFLISKTDQLKLNKKEHYEIRWFTREELDDEKYKLSVQIKFYAKHALLAAKKEEL